MRRAFEGQARSDAMRLARSEGVGSVTFARLVARHGGPGAALRALEREGRMVASVAAVEAELAAVARLGARHLLPGDADYPPLLCEVADPPPLLVALGDARLAARPVVAIVGARNASAAGRRLAGEIAAGLSAMGWVVASGLARGIDGAAHAGALGGGTIGCVAGGVDIVYPPEHRALQEAIGASGLLLSEWPPGTEPLARHFPRRNRLIAGVAAGLVVVEGAAGSGSLITARLAGAWGREVMAVPGHPSDPRSRGGNGLLKDGATLVESAEDVAAVLRPFAAPDRTPATGRAGAAAGQPRRAAAPVAAMPRPGRDGFVALLGAAGVTVDELVRASGLGVAEVQALVSELELDGRAVRLDGGRVARA